MIAGQGLDDAPSGDHWRWLIGDFNSVNAPVGSRISPQQLIASRSQQK